MEFFGNEYEPTAIRVFRLKNYGKGHDLYIFEYLFKHRKGMFAGIYTAHNDLPRMSEVIHSFFI